MNDDANDWNRIRAIAWLKLTVSENEFADIAARFSARHRDASSTRKVTLAWFVIEACKSRQVPFVL